MLGGKPVLSQEHGFKESKWTVCSVDIHAYYECPILLCFLWFMRYMPGGICIIAYIVMKLILCTCKLYIDIYISVMSLLHLVSM